MCGIVAYWAKEALLTKDQYDILLTGAEERGQNGIGISIFHKNKTWFVIKNLETYSKAKKEILKRIVEEMKIGSIMLVNCRATPETEPASTTFEQLQPICKDGLFLVHNGGVTDSVVKEWDCKMTTAIDSEYIIEAYKKYGNNMNEAMEHLSGSFAFVMYDGNKDKLFSVTSFNPLAHMYIRGYGYFLHSSNDCLEKVLFDITKQCRDGMNVWEAWYHHYLDGYSIIETDIQSGFQSPTTYKPYFLYPENNKPKSDKKVALVCCSGGIDSSLTAYVLHKCGYDVTMIHFLYGQKSEACEKWAIEQLTATTGIKNKIIDVRNIFNFQGSMLLDKDVQIDTGGDKIKSTIAWTPGRNAIFSSIMFAEAENIILTENVEKVYIASGWAQLSEETGGYPDNSFKFIEALNELKKYGYITGHKMEFLPVMQKLLKTEEWMLGDYLKFPFLYTVSCDNPIMGTSGIPILCTECGSTKLSCTAAYRAGIEDPRMFNHNYLDAIINVEVGTLPTITEIINRLILPDTDKNTLYLMV